MRVKIWFAAALLVLSTVTVALAQEPVKKEMTPEAKAAMDAMMKAMTPGDAHKLLNSMAGSFDAKVTLWMDPTAPPMVAPGTMESKWILGDRYLEQRFTSSMMGMPFNGIGYTGYDNVKKEYWSTWIDNMSTGVMTSTGNTADKGKSWKFTASSSDPLTGKTVITDTRFTVADADHHVMETWGPAPDGKQYKMMEIAYTRKK